MFLQRGTAQISSENKTVVLSEGEALHIPRGARYSVKLFGEPEISFGSYAYLSFMENGTGAYSIEKLDLSERMYELISCVSRIGGVSYESVGYFYLFLHEMYKTIVPSLDSGKQSLLERAMAFIVRHPECRISEVAEHCHISESGLYALFSERADFTPARFKLYVKLERAVNYLISTDIPIEEISDLCGFSSSSYFRKKLFDVYKKTPTDIRRGGHGCILGF
jgi:AraC-like DNA-binding protein